MGDEEETTEQKVDRQLNRLRDELNTVHQALQLFNNAQLPDIKPQTYDGKSDFILYLKDFNKVATAANWSPQRCTQILPLYLRGDAKALYDMLDPNKKNAWKPLIDSLAEKLSKLDSSENARRRLNIARQGEKTVLQFAEDIRHLIEKAYSAAKGYSDEQRNDLALDVLRRGLNDEIRSKLLFLEKPTTFGEGIAKAVDIDDIIQTEKREKQKEGKFAQIEKSIEEIKSSINSLSLNSSSSDAETNGIYWINQNENLRQPRQFYNNFRPTYQNNNFQQRGRGRAGYPVRFNNVEGNSIGQSGSYAESNRWRGNRGNFRPYQGNQSRGGRQRGRGAYRILPIQIPSAPAWSILTIICIIIGLTNGTNGQFQICNKDEAKTLVDIPKEINCILPKRNYTITNIELFIPKAIPKIFDIYQCYEEITRICTSSFMVFSHRITSQMTQRKAITPEVCETTVRELRDKRGEQLIAQKPDYWRTEIDDRIRYSFVGEACEDTTNTIVRRGEGGILNGKLITTWHSDINPYISGFIEIDAAYIWQIPDATYFETHEKLNVEAEVSDELVIIHSLQNGFIKSKNQSKQIISIGIPEDAIALENEAFMRIMSKNRTKKEIKPRQPMRAPTTVAPRKPKRINPEATTTTPSTVRTTPTAPTTKIMTTIVQKITVTTTTPKPLTANKTEVKKFMETTNSNLITTMKTPIIKNEVSETKNLGPIIKFTETKLLIPERPPISLQNKKIGAEGILENTPIITEATKQTTTIKTTQATTQIQQKQTPQPTIKTNDVITTMGPILLKPAKPMTTTISKMKTTTPPVN